MEQKYYCTNCGTPVACGESYCRGCGINFKWITRADLPPSEEVPCSLPQAPKVLSQQRQLEEGAKPVPAAVGDRNSLREIDTVTPLRNDISRLLESFFAGHARYNKT